jgi:hypothetical protein
LSIREPAPIREDGREVWSLEVKASELRYRVFAGPTHSRPSAASPTRPVASRLRAGDGGSGPGTRLAFRRPRHTAASSRSGRTENMRQKRQRAGRFHTEGLATLSYLNPMIGEEYAEGLQVRSDGTTCIPPGTWIELWAGSNFDPVTRSLVLTGDRYGAGHGTHVGPRTSVVPASQRDGERTLATPSILIDGLEVERSHWSYGPGNRVLRVIFESSAGVPEIVTNEVR